MSWVDLRGASSRVHGRKAFGRLEVLDSDVDSSTTSVRKPCTLESSAKKQADLKHGKLQVLSPTDTVFTHVAEDAPRPGSGRKCYTPTKQISLCTVKPVTPSHDIPDYSLGEFIDFSIPQKEKLVDNIGKRESTAVQSKSHPASEMTAPPEESSSEEEDSEDEKQRAPIELLAEFIRAVMDKKYKLAWKLCQMILLYEPENLEAKEFSPLIHEMLQNDEEQDSEEEDGNDTDEEDDEDSNTEDSDSDGDSDSSDETSETSSEDETGA